MMGKTISHYKILEKIGEGGMGVVYKAQDTKLGRDVALKTLPEEFAQDADRVTRFKREAKLLASLNHPNIAAIHGLEEEEDARFLVLEMVEGETLAERLHKEALTVEEALDICTQIAGALEAAHEKGIIHRDLKPGNVKITPEGKVKVLDFGLAKAFETAVSGEAPGIDLSKSPTITAESSRSGVILGTAAYMSPEQARGKRLDKRTDIWSFGCMLYEILAGRQAFVGETISDTIVAILEHEPKWEVLPETTPDKIRNLLRRCLQKDPNKRLHDIADARIEIEETLSETLGPLQALPKIEGRIRSIKGRRLIFTYVLLAIVSALASGAVVWFFARSPDINVKPNVTPVVVLMDSPIPERVYDPETRANHGTNADDINDILRDLPLVLHKEAVTSAWHREDQVIKQNPDLVVVHRGCFYGGTALSVSLDSTVVEHIKALAEGKLIAFLGYVALANPETKFLVYSRSFKDESLWVEHVVQRFERLRGKVVAMTVPGGAGPHFPGEPIRSTATFRDPETARQIRRLVLSMLNIKEGNSK